jgi:hypothetical protein
MQQKVVSLVFADDKIRVHVVVLNLIEVMNLDSIWKNATKRMFSDCEVFSNVAFGISAWMIRIQYHDIPSVDRSPTVPVIVR